MTSYTFKNRTVKGPYLGDVPKVGTVILEIDWERLVTTFGGKAAFNTGKKARTLKGAIVAKFKESKKKTA
jgi:hypothetical protein